MPEVVKRVALKEHDIGPLVQCVVVLEDKACERFGFPALVHDAWRGFVVHKDVPVHGQQPGPIHGFPVLCDDDGDSRHQMASEKKGHRRNDVHVPLLTHVNGEAPSTVPQNVVVVAS